MALWTVADQAGVGVPPEHALFLGEDDAVGEGGAGLDEAVRDVLRPGGPRVPLLVLAVAARGAASGPCTSIEDAMKKDYRMLACLCLQVLVDGDVLVAMVVDVDDDDVAPARADGQWREARSGEKKSRAGMESCEWAGFSSAAAVAEDLSGRSRLEWKGAKK